jgi:hypothetical protein
VEFDLSVFIVMTPSKLRRLHDDCLSSAMQILLDPFKTNESMRGKLLNGMQMFGHWLWASDFIARVGIPGRLSSAADIQVKPGKGTGGTSY